MDVLGKCITFSIIFAVVLGASSNRVESKAKKSLGEPKAQVGEPAPIEGDCPCSKVACVGDKGPKGDRGAAGPTGPKGPKGETGDAGQEGPKGDKGPLGALGPRGPPGLNGKPGLSGKPGVDGAKGELGPRGSAGERGPQGLAGSKGEQGARGLTGEAGTRGAKGERGVPGNDGKLGPKGDTGETGAQGPKGKSGSAGPTGPKGAPGTQGPQGGIGPMGPKGPKGPAGANGAQGPQGPEGAKGDRGHAGSRGATGVQGPKGSQGLRGVQGLRGPPGSCASQCSEIKKQLDARIDALKKYTDGKVSHLQQQIDELKRMPTAPPAPNVHPLGSEHNPAKSCSDIAKAKAKGKKHKYYRPTHPNGVYWLKTETSTRKSQVYCHMSSIRNCGGGSWTMVMKLNGHTRSLGYNSKLWTNTQEFNPNNGRTGFDQTETKVATYWSTPFQYICLGMKVHNKFKFVRIKYSAKSLYSLIADGKYRPTKIGRNTWKQLLDPKGSLQKNCNKEGFNADSKAAGARIGIVANQERDCNSCDSYIGFGTRGYGCGINDSNSCGNEARCDPDNGERSTRAYGYILVQ